MSDGNSDSRRSVLKKIGATAVGGSLLSFTGSAKPAWAEVSGKIKRNAQRTARGAVDELADREEYSDWRRQAVKSPELFYEKIAEGDEVEYVPSALVFPIEDRGEDLGHITIGAYGGTPVLAYGTGKAPQREYDGAKKAAKASGRSVHKRFIYHGGTEYAVETADKKEPVGTPRGRTREEHPVVDLRAKNIKHKVAGDTEWAIASGSPWNGSDSDAREWDGPADDQVRDVPNWTTTDDGDWSSTYIGSAPDEWDEWDGCVPIAASMIIGYHEGVDESKTHQREKIIDRLHITMNTDDDTGATMPWDVDNGIEDYSEGRYSYGANNDRLFAKSTVETQIARNQPLILSMSDGPYTEFWNGEDGITEVGGPGGHAVTIVGYRIDTSGWLDDWYYKVHDTYGDVEEVAHGNWRAAQLTKVWKK